MKNIYKRDLYLSSQKQIDDLRDELLDIDEIDGNLKIERSDITNISALKNITHVSGDLIIEYNRRLKHFNFSSLQSIGNFFLVKKNSQLTDLGDFSSLQSIGGTFWVRDNNKLTDFGDFSSLQSIEDDFMVEDNRKLTDLGDFPALKFIGRSFSLLSNRELTDVGRFPSLTSIGVGPTGDSIAIRDNSNLLNYSVLNQFLEGGRYEVEGEKYIIIDR